jgi:hypothetical protein
VWPLSGIPSLPRQPFTHPEKEEVLPTPVEGCKYEYDSNPVECKQRSPFALIIYLNEDYEGGETTSFLPTTEQGVFNAYPVHAVMGILTVFPHGDASEAPLHEGMGVSRGAKYVY